MRRSLLLVAAALALVPWMLPVPALAGVPSAAGEVPARLASLHLPFVANQGQVDARVAYYAPTFAGTAFVTRRGEVVYALHGPGADRWSLTETMVRGRARPVGRDAAATGVSSFLGNDPARWRSHLATWDQVSLGEVWPGVMVALRARGRSVEKVFRVSPGAKVDRIRVGVAGVRGLAVEADGSLVARTGRGPVTFSAPVAYQERDGERHPVAVAYRRRGTEYGFSVGPYDASLPLVIDPLLQSTYLGGAGADVAFALAIHPATGDVYVTGQGASIDFPGTAGGAQPSNAGGAFGDAFVARLNGSLTTLIQATYLGGSGLDRAFALAIHPTSGNIYVAGETTSTNFPGTAGGAQPVAGGFLDAFVARLPSTLTSLTQATYLGGSGSDEAFALAIHPTTGDVYVAGSTGSSNFPGTAGGAQPVMPGAGDAFVARLPSTLTSLTQATYLGGSATDVATALAVHAMTGEVYVGGYTNSANFPATAGGAQPTFGGGPDDAFVARLPGTLTSLTQATYLGGSGDDLGGALAIHPTTGNVYVAGRTNSANFPATAGGAQPVNAGGAAFGDAFVARLPSTLTSLTQATYLGGSGDDYAAALAIHPTTGNVYVAGTTPSNPFPGTAGGAQPAVAGGVDAFIARLPSTLTSVIQATYLGGSTGDSATALAIHPTTGEIYVAGSTDSSNFPGTAGGAQSTFRGSPGSFSNAFIARLTADLALGSTAVPTLSEWAVLAMVILLIVTGVVAIRHRRFAR